MSFLSLLLTFFSSSSFFFCRLGLYDVSRFLLLLLLVCWGKEGLLNACAFIYTMGQDVKNANGEPGNKKKIQRE